jgi:O-methyltransferase involved in polyketide biosynthesis
MTRTERDTWDTASSVGATATGCAAVRVLASRQPAPLINDPFAAPLVQHAGIPAFADMVAGRIEPAACSARWPNRSLTAWPCAPDTTTTRCSSEPISAGRSSCWHRA